MSWITEVAPVITSVGSLAGVGAALYVSVKTRKEVRADRLIRVLPVLAFERGGYRIDVNRSEFNHRIGCFSPESVKEVFAATPGDALVNRLIEANFPVSVGSLINHGQGTAFDIRITWVARTVHLKSESFAIDARKGEEPRYHTATNTLPAVPSNLPPGSSAHIPQIPAFAYMDTEAQLKSADGHVEINYRDAFGNNWKTVQTVYIAMGYEEKPYFHCTFLDLEELPSIKQLP
ncbi:hypothetical protein [Streptomyces sp. NPDC005533]|uniref:hypothetical protein n=1 Tax=Streptomyces sp. NPDC005533 TaxID=3364723 RepID=UPI0036847EDC